MKIYPSPHTDQIRQKLFNICETLHSETNQLDVCNKEILPQNGKESISLTTQLCKVDNKVVLCLLSTTPQRYTN